ncbi:hypothetical protein [Paraburkholderia lacunae]|uniref:hypothetical protein n=1 Tax=Paraburkholderia lacunae TaxID=2211104 RepID=UPI001058FB4C|nr:hypothetical protein [Paraburkholderia lacunae]
MLTDAAHASCCGAEGRNEEGGPASNDAAPSGVVARHREMLREYLQISFIRIGIGRKQIEQSKQQPFFVPLCPSVGYRAQ